MKDELRNAASLLGRRGGLATSKKYSKEFYREIGRKGADKRWHFKQKIAGHLKKN